MGPVSALVFNPGKHLHEMAYDVQKESGHGVSEVL